ncbi:MAG: DUF4198 domain-containing protein [Pseudomonadota bacterium]
MAYHSIVLGGAARSVLAFGFLLAPLSAEAHFGMVLPDTAMVGKDADRSVDVTFAFLHPFGQFGMELVPPASVTVHSGESTTDLTEELVPATVFDEPAFTASVPLTRPGTYTIAMEPEPYWEPAEDVFIIHYTKAAIAAFGDDTGWDAELGLPTEIIPLTRPFGLWEGNVFQGIVKSDGAPVPFAEIEVEFWNDAGVSLPDELMETQSIKADANGVFTYAPPGPGWWAFAALSTADYTMEQDGVDKNVELGAVFWVNVEPWP